MRLLMALCAAPLLSGCWFVILPIGAISDAISGTEGQHCVGRAAEVGSQLKFQDGRIGTVKKLEGPSSRCRNENFPIRALVAFE